MAAVAQRHITYPSTRLVKTIVGKTVHRSITSLGSAAEAAAFRCSPRGTRRRKETQGRLQNMGSSCWTMLGRLEAFQERCQDEVDQRSIFGRCLGRNRNVWPPRRRVQPVGHETESAFCLRGCGVVFLSVIPAFSSHLTLALVSSDQSLGAICGRLGRIPCRLRALLSRHGAIWELIGQSWSDLGGLLSPLGQSDA